MDYAGLHGGLATCSPVHRHHGGDIQLFSSSFTALAGEAVSFREAAILSSPRTIEWRGRAQFGTVH
jgi:hypothetical protein